MKDLHELAFSELQDDLWDRMEYINVSDPDADARHAYNFRARVEGLGFSDGTRVREVVAGLGEMRETYQQLARDIAFLMIQIGASEEMDDFLRTGRIR